MIKRVLLASMVLALACAGGAFAGKNGGGAMLLHVSDTIHYTPGGDFCGTALGVTDCSGVVTRSDGDGSVETMVWVLGLFTHTQPAVTGWAFGLIHNLPTGYFSDFGACPAGAFQIPDLNWPDESGTGVAVAVNPAVTDTVMVLYWFAPSRGPDTQLTYFMSTAPYTGGDGHAEFTDDGSPPLVDFVTNFGTMRWGADGEKSCPTPPPAGACCLPWAQCTVLLEGDCVAAHGTYLGDSSVCDASNACSACCYTVTGPHTRECAVVSEAYCLNHFSSASSGGVYENPAWAGLKQDGTGLLCAPSADSAAVEWWCDFPETPTRNATWGKVKSLFR